MQIFSSSYSYLQSGRQRNSKKTKSKSRIVYQMFLNTCKMWRYILLTLFLLWQSCGILAHHRFQWKYQHVRIDSVTGTNIQLKEEMFLLPGIIWKDSMGFSLKIKHRLMGPQLENSGIRDLIFMRVYDNNPRPDIRIVIDGQPINMVSLLVF